MSMTKFNMTYGLYIGIAYILVIMSFHLTGHLHFPGDQSGWLNAGLLGFSMVYVIRKYQLITEEKEMPYKLVLRISMQLSFFSSLIFAFFIYWYYGFIAQDGIANFIEMVEMAFVESGAFSESQQEMLLEMYHTSLNPGVMAFTCGFSQFILGFFISLFVPFVLKMSNRFIKTSKLDRNN